MSNDATVAALQAEIARLNEEARYFARAAAEHLNEQVAMRKAAQDKVAALEAWAKTVEPWRARWGALKDWLVGTTLGRPRAGEQEYGIIVRQLVLDQMERLEHDGDATSTRLGS